MCNIFTIPEHFAVRTWQDFDACLTFALDCMPANRINKSVNQNSPDYNTNLFENSESLENKELAQAALFSIPPRFSEVKLHKIFYPNNLQNIAQNCSGNRLIFSNFPNNHRGRILFPYLQKRVIILLGTWTSHADYQQQAVAALSEIAKQHPLCSLGTPRSHIKSLHFEP
jgi:hypothetical protein